MPKTVKYIGSAKRWPELSATGKQSVWYPGQIEDRSAAEASQLLATGLFQLYEEVLTAAQVAALHATQAEAAGVHYNNTAAQNVAKFNAALARRGLVTLSTPGQYLVGSEGAGGLILPSNTTLVCVEGVEIIAGPSMREPLIRNASSFLPGIQLSTVVTYAVAAPGFRARIDHPGIDLLYPVGSWFGLLGLLGDNSNNRGYQGVWQVIAVEADQIFFQLPHAPPSGGHSHTTGIVFPADTNMRIIGGMWDGNEVDQDTGVTFAGDPRQMIHHFRNAQNIIVSDVKFRPGLSWCFGSNNIRDATVRRVDANTYDGPGVVQSHDIVHLSGGHRNILIEDIEADCDDNIVGMGLNGPDGDGAGGGVTYAYYNPGDTYDVTIRRINGRETSAALVAMWGNINYRHHNTLIDEVQGKSPGALVQVYGAYAPTEMLNCNGGFLKITNVRGSCNAAPIAIRSDGVWDHIIIDTVHNNSVAAQPLVLVDRSATTQTIKKLEIKNVAQFTHGAVQNRSNPAVWVINSSIEDLVIEGLEGMRLAANTSLVMFSGTVGVINRAVVEKASSQSSAAGDSFIVSCENTGAGSLGALTIRDAHMAGTSSTGGVVRQTGDSKVATIRLDNCTQTGGEGVSVAEAGSTAVVTTVSAA